MKTIELEEWWPMPPNMGPPLPKSMRIYWPWYKPPTPPEVIYACPYCGAKFSSEAELLEHIRTAHAQQPPRIIYMCPYCGAKFSTLSELQQHISAAHPVAPPGAPPPTPEVPPAAADIRLGGLTIKPTKVTVGETVTITITAKNYGGASGSRSISCDINGSVSKQTVELGPGESKQVSFSATPKEANTYQVSVDGLTGSFTATKAAKVGEFTVRIINYDEILNNAAKTGLTPKWYAQIPSSITYQGQPITYLRPSDGRGYRPLSDDCPFSVPEGSQFWNPYPYLSIWITAGPACDGIGWSDPTCRSYGVIYKSDPMDIAPGAIVVYDYSKHSISVVQ